MARSFNGSSDRLRTTTLPTTVIDNFTLCGWVKFNTLAGTQRFVQNGFDGGGTGNGYALGVQNSGGFKAFMNFGFVANITGTTTISTGTWYHICGVRRSGTAHIYLNGASENTSGSTPNAPVNSYHIGSNENNVGAGLEWVDGTIAEVALWDRALTAEEITALAKGVSPIYFQRNLKRYDSLLGTTERSQINAAALTVTGTTVTDHPRRLYPVSLMTDMVANAAAPGGGGGFAIFGDEALVA